MTDREKEARKRLSALVRVYRQTGEVSIADYGGWPALIEDIGSLTCAAGRLDFMEEKAEAFAGTPAEGEHEEYARDVARVILGWASEVRR